MKSHSLNHCVCVNMQQKRQRPVKMGVHWSYTGIPPIFKHTTGIHMVSLGCSGQFFSYPWRQQPAMQHAMRMVKAARSAFKLSQLEVDSQAWFCGNGCGINFWVWCELRL
jgi:hypothetical protein